MGEHRRGHAVRYVEAEGVNRGEGQSAAGVSSESGRKRSRKSGWGGVEAPALSPSPETPKTTSVWLEPDANLASVMSGETGVETTAPGWMDTQRTQVRPLPVLFWRRLPMRP